MLWLRYERLLILLQQIDLLVRHAQYSGQEVQVVATVQTQVNDIFIADETMETNPKEPLQ